LRVQDHIGLISWSLADKALFILYGFVLIVIMNYTMPAEFGLYSLLIGLHTWIFTISDSFSLQSLIQFGMNEGNRRKVNLIALGSHLLLTLGISLVVFVLRYPLADLFNEPRILDVAAFLPVLSIAFIPRTYSQKIIYRIQNMFYLFLTNFVFFGVMSVMIFLKISTVKFLSFNDLAYIYLFGSIASSLMALVLIRKELRFSRTGEIGWRKVYNFSWKMTVINLLHSFPRNIDIFIIKIFFPIETIGLYAAAKNLFRLFEEILNAMNGLVYPSAVKNEAANNKQALFDLMTKSVSFIFVGFAGLVIVLETGVSEWLINLVLNERYMQSVGYFNLLIIAAPFLALWYIFSIMMAKNKLIDIIKISTVSFLCSLTMMLIIGVLQLDKMVPLGYGTYIIVSGILAFYYGNNYLQFKFNYIFRAFNDIFFYLKKKYYLK